MKRLISTALVLSLLAGASAMAAPQDNNRDQRGGGQQRAAPPAGAARPQAARPQGVPQRGPGPQHGGGAPGQGPQRGPGGPNGQFRAQTVPQAGARGPGGAIARGQAIRPQDRAARDANRPRYDRRNWTFMNHPSQRFHWRGPAWVAPLGFYRHAWAYGEVLPFGWYTPNYYINDWDFYGLPPAPYGCEWVREGSDAVLVDVFTGRVLSVEYGLFF